MSRFLDLAFPVALIAVAGPGCGSSGDGPSTTAGSTTPGGADQNEPVAQDLKQVNLVSDQPGTAAQTDARLVNAWGLSFASAGRAWVSANKTGSSEVYDSAGALQLSVTIPASGTSPSSPTGQVFNPQTSNFGGDFFIFVTEDGTIAGWQPSNGTTATIRLDNSSAGAVYKGVTMATTASGTRLYAADFHNGRIEVLDSGYHPLTTSGGFVDKDLPADFAPFNVLGMSGGFVLVSYAKQLLPDRKDDDAALGNGFVDVFDADGKLLKRLVSNGKLDSPWGMTIAPSGFGKLSQRLLVGNFGDGRIHAYRLTLGSTGGPESADPEGVIGNGQGQPLVIDGLWSLEFGPGAGGFNSNQLFFTAGPAKEAHGLFGHLEVP